MDVVLAVVLGLAAIGALAGLTLLIRREIRFRRLPSDAQREHPSRPLDAEAAAYAAQISRGTGGIP